MKKFRKFGVEIEINSMDGRDFKKYPLSYGEMPKGINYVCDLIKKRKVPAIVNEWQNTHNNNVWVCKPDSSCGIEICSPVIDDSFKLKKTYKIIDELGSDPRIKVDNRCSLHVHFDVTDKLNNFEFVSILVWWIKCEAVMLDSVPNFRKMNSFCRPIGFLDFFQHNENINPKKVFKLLGKSKYYTINTYHMNKGKRNTIEFRILEGEGCLNKKLFKNWIFFLKNFINRSLQIGFPKKYKKGDYRTSFQYLDPIDVFEFLGFFEANLSKEQSYLKKWFIDRLKNNINSNVADFWSKKGRNFSICQLEEIIDKN